MIAKGGRAAVVISSACAVPALALHVYAAAAFVVLAAFLAVVFRDPRRTIGKGVVSPADGTVREVDPSRGYLSIYLALRNVHVTRAPIDGTVVRTVHVTGRHSPAFSRRSAEN